MAQLEMFNAAPSVSAAPSAEQVRARLEAIFATLRSGDKLAMSEVRRLAVAVPQMAQWLPTEEREVVRAEFAAELERVKKAA